MRQGGSGRCNFPPPQNLTVEQTDYTLGAFEKRTATAAFSAKGDWTLSIVYDNDEAGDETDADAAWLTADAASGAAGKQTVELAATPKITEESRTAYVDIACGKQSVRLTVTQTGAFDETNFSALFAPGFAQVLQEKGHISDAGNITLNDLEKIAAITELDVSRSSSLTSLQGIEYFESLTELQCSFNELASLDLSNNTALTELQCYENQLTELDLSKNTALMALNCYDNLLKELDISKNTALIYLECDNNPGDGESKFPVTAWFDSTAVPADLYIPSMSWTYEDKTIAIDYRTATAE